MTPKASGGEPSSSTFYFRAVVSGRVQGVGFRMWTMDTAESLGVRGYVRNLWNRDVEVEAEGPREVLEQFEKRLWDGPVLSRVSNIEIEWGERLPRHKEFQVTY